MKAQALVAWNLRRLRVGRGFSLENLAVDAGIDRTYVSRLERGLENPTVGVLEAVISTGSSITGGSNNRDGAMPTVVKLCPRRID
jgi:transcriptional regulator with XRE-family HTH domain